MSHFYGSMEGSRGAVTRTARHCLCGSGREEGIQAHIRGWDFGCRVYINYKNGKDTVQVYRTGGSGNSGGPDELLIEFDGEEVIWEDEDEPGAFLFSRKS